jgi:hypothetical protein
MPQAAARIQPEFAALLVPLAVPVEFSRYCVVCDSMQAFIADYETDYGLWGYCRRCGDERIQPWTRITVKECA